MTLSSPMEPVPVDHCPAPVVHKFLTNHPSTITPSTVALYLPSNFNLLNLKISEFEGFYSRVGDCTKDVPSLLGGTTYNISLLECEKRCSIAHEKCPTFIYDTVERKCEIKSMNCPNLDANDNRIVFQRKQLDNYFDRNGECIATVSEEPFLELAGMATAKDCANACGGECVFFVYSKASQECWIHTSSCKEIKPAADRELFEKIEFYNYVRYSGTCDGVGDTQILRNSTRPLCAEQCSGTFKCTAFSFDDSQNTCVLWGDKDCNKKRDPLPNFTTYIKMSHEELSCDFESDSSSNCQHWNPHPDFSNDFELRFVSSHDGYGLNGPKRDTTIGVDGQGGYLLAVFGNSGHSIGTAQISGPSFDSSTAHCLTFSYYMFGPSVGQLNVILSQQNGVQTDQVWSRTGSSVDKWLEGRINLDELVTDGGQINVIFIAFSIFILLQDFQRFFCSVIFRSYFNGRLLWSYCY